MSILALTIKLYIIIEYMKQGETSSMWTEINAIHKNSNNRKSNVSDDFTALDMLNPFLCEENDVCLIMHMRKQLVYMEGTARNLAKMAEITWSFLISQTWKKSVLPLYFLFDARD